MAGGMGRRDGPTLAQRTGAPVDAAPPVPEPAGAGSSPGSRSVVRRHCWVDGPPESAARCAGLLVEWRQDPSGAWEGRVVYVVPGPPGRPVVVEAWLPAGLLGPA